MGRYVVVVGTTPEWIESTARDLYAQGHEVWCLWGESLGLPGDVLVRAAIPWVLWSLRTFHHGVDYYAEALARHMQRKGKWGDPRDWKKAEWVSQELGVAYAEVVAKVVEWRKALEGAREGEEWPIT